MRRLRFRDQKEHGEQAKKQETKEKSDWGAAWVTRPILMSIWQEGRLRSRTKENGLGNESRLYRPGIRIRAILTSMIVRLRTRPGSPKDKHTITKEQPIGSKQET